MSVPGFKPLPYEPLGLEDEIRIRSLLANYVHLLDDGDGHGWARLFTSDGEWSRTHEAPVSKGGSGMPAETLKGWDDLERLVQRSVVENFRKLSRHQMTDVVLGAGDTPTQAIGKCRLLITDWRDGTGRISMVGDYQFEFARTPEGWRIASILADFLPRP